MTTAARIILAAGWCMVAVLALALAILTMPVRAVWSWYAVRPGRAYRG